MLHDWLELSLGDVITLQRGFDLPNRERIPGNVPVVSSSGISGIHSEAKVSAPGVVTGRYGTIGQVFYIKEDYWPLNTTLFVKDFKGNDPLFVSFLLRTIDFLSCSDKSSVPGLNRNDLHLIKVKLPPLSEQKAIAHILGTLDDKIELNREMNQTLEAMARAIFKSWFVDFDPVRAKMEGRQPAGMDAATAELFPDEFEESALGMIPKGWRIGKLDDLLILQRGFDLPASQRIPGNYPVIAASGASGTHAEYKVTG
ncbi:MAG: restriction endonuclease subunit S, partial [Nostoc sp.]